MNTNCTKLLAFLALLLAVLQCTLISANEPYMGSKLVEDPGEDIQICNIPCGFCNKKIFFKVCPFMCQRCAERKRQDLDVLDLEELRRKQPESREENFLVEAESSNWKSAKSGESGGKTLTAKGSRQRQRQRVKSAEIMEPYEMPAEFGAQNFPPLEPKRSENLRKTRPSTTTIINSLGEEIAVVNNGWTNNDNDKKSKNNADKEGRKELKNLIVVLGGKEKQVEKSFEIDQGSTPEIFPETTEFVIQTTEIPTTEESETVATVKKSKSGTFSKNSESAREEDELESSIEVIDVITVTRVQEQQQILDEYANKMFTNCCSYRGLRSCAAIGVCRYNTTMTILRSAASKGCNVGAELNTIMSCASNNNDNTKCCQEMGVDSIDGNPTPQCLDMCVKDGLAPVKFSHSVCVPSYIDALKCHKQGVMQRTAVFESNKPPKFPPKNGEQAGAGKKSAEESSSEKKPQNKSDFEEKSKKRTRKRPANSETSDVELKEKSSKPQSSRRRRPLKTGRGNRKQVNEVEPEQQKVQQVQATTKSPPKPKPLDPYTLEAIAIPLRLFLGGLP